MNEPLLINSLAQYYKCYVLPNKRSNSNDLKFISNFYTVGYVPVVFKTSEMQNQILMVQKSTHLDPGNN